MKLSLKLKKLKNKRQKNEYKIKDYVVYLKHGVGQITEFKKIVSVVSMLKHM